MASTSPSTLPRYRPITWAQVRLRGRLPPPPHLLGLCGEGVGPGGGHHRRPHPHLAHHPARLCGEPFLLMHLAELGLLTNRRLPNSKFQCAMATLPLVKDQFYNRFAALLHDYILSLLHLSTASTREASPPPTPPYGARGDVLRQQSGLGHGRFLDLDFRVDASEAR